MAAAPDEARALLEGSRCWHSRRHRRDDPFSDAYREWTWDLYRRISGRAGYDTAHESSPFDLAAALARPFPYQSGSLALVGRDLVARGHLLDCLADGPPAAASGSSSSAPAGATSPGTWWRRGSTSPRSSWTRSSARLIAPRCQAARPPHRRAGRHARFSTERAVRRRRVLRELPPLRRSPGHAAAPARHRAPRRRRALRAPSPCSGWTTRGGRGSTGSPSGRAGRYGWLELGFDNAYFDRALARTGWAGRSASGSGAPWARQT